MLSHKFDQICLSVIDKIFAPMSKGRLKMLLPDGTFLNYGDGSSGIKAEMEVHDLKFFRKCVLYGAVGFGESYVDGDWTTSDITKVIAWMLLNVEHHPTLNMGRAKRSPVNFLKFFNVLKFWARANTLRGSRKNISDHYDLGNEFFKVFLDKTMTYSSAYFKSPKQSLEEAQLEKYGELCKKLRLKEEDHLLEIGSGWGGFCVYAAKNYGCRVTTTTISKEQYAYVQQRIVDENLSEKIEVLLCDYRKLTGKYDKVASIEMIEAVGHKFLPTYLKQCRNLLKDNGLLGLQMILFPDLRYEQARKNVDWIQKHIFPGSLLPSLQTIHKSMRETGDFCLFGYEDITVHYVKTLALWRESFNKKIDEIRAIGKDQCFIRKWNYYFSYCEAAFRMRHISVAHAVYTPMNNASLCDPLDMELSVEDKKFLDELEIFNRT